MNTEQKDAHRHVEVSRKQTTDTDDDGQTVFQFTQNARGSVNGKEALVKIQLSSSGLDAGMHYSMMACIEETMRSIGEMIGADLDAVQRSRRLQKAKAASKEKLALYYNTLHKRAQQALWSWKVAIDSQIDHNIVDKLYKEAREVSFEEICRTPRVSVSRKRKQSDDMEKELVGERDSPPTLDKLADVAEVLAASPIPPKKKKRALSPDKYRAVAERDGPTSQLFDPLEGSLCISGPDADRTFGDRYKNFALGERWSKEHCAILKLLSSVSGIDLESGLTKQALAQTLSGSHVKYLGDGYYSQVFAVHYAKKSKPSVFGAIKLTPFEELKTTVELGTNRAMAIVVQMEAVISQFLTRQFLMGSDAAPHGHTPNFLGTLAWDITERPLVPCDVSSCRPTKKGVVCAQMLTELCQGATLNEFFLGVCDSSLGSLAAADFVASICGQILLSISAYGSIGLSHNDLHMENVFVRYKSVPYDNLIYGLPLKMRARQTDGRRFVKLAAGAATPLVVIGDFGMATLENWAGDPRRSPAMTPRSSASQHYYGDSNMVDETLETFNLGEENTKSLRYRQLPAASRDFSVFLSDILLWCDKDDTKGCARSVSIVDHVRAFATRAMDLLDAVRPINYDEQLEFVERVLENYTHDEPGDAQSEIFLLPDQIRAAHLHEKLIAELEAPHINGTTHFAIWQDDDEEEE